MNGTIFRRTQPLRKNAFHVIKNNSTMKWTEGKIVFPAINDDNRFRSSRDAENVLMKLEFYLQLEMFTQRQQLRSAR